MLWVEGHISHCSRVLRRCHPKWSSCSLLVTWNKNFPFYEPQFGRISLNISLSDSVLETKKLQAKVLNLTCRGIYVCKLLQNVKFDGFAFLTALVLYNQSDYFNYFNRDSNCSVLYESIEYTDDTFVRFGNNVCFENWK